MNIDKLKEPFDSSYIKSRRGSFGRQLVYVEGHHYIDRLNEAFDYDWSFEIVEHQITEDEVIVHGRITAGNFSKSAFGGTAIKKRKDDGTIISLADDLKAAATDSMKKAASLLGLGLHLYDNDSKQTSTRNDERDYDDYHDSRDNSSDSNSVTDKQIKAIYAIGGKFKVDVKDFVQEQYGTELKSLNKKQASEVIQALQRKKIDQEFENTKQTIRDDIKQDIDATQVEG